jgi:hypothetical protein
MFKEKDLQQIASRGMGEEDVNNQIRKFKEGFPYLNIIEPAIPGNGLIQLPEGEISYLAKMYDEARNQLSILKFVPASGAASRMFKSLFAFYEALTDGQSADDFLANNPEVKDFFSNLDKFAFYSELKKTLDIEGLKLQELLQIGGYKTILEYFLMPSGMNYGNLPKGLLTFHFYTDSTSRTAMEEHLVEGALYAAGKDDVVRLHLTVSPEHQQGFSELITRKKEAYEKKFGIKLEIEFSEQKPATDMIAVDMENKPFRNDDGSLLFRPGGHGALIENLNDLEADIIFVKNIDNVVPDRLKDQTVLYKKSLAGLLLMTRRKIESIFNELKQNPADPALVESAMNTIQNELFVISSATVKKSDIQEKAEWCLSILNRPLRVCGMVKNEGEPGGGPFWAENPDGSVSLQIVESSQIDLVDPAKKKIFDGLTHFNPVDLVCSTLDFEGNKYDLLKYRDPKTGFISIKSKDGKELKAQELPGLWNGAMSNWNTLFVEVPIITFNPVKTINDLLRPQHAM